jgi:hypothetical protein
MTTDSQRGRGVILKFSENSGFKQVILFFFVFKVFKVYLFYSIYFLSTFSIIFFFNSKPVD